MDKTNSARPTSRQDAAGRDTFEFPDFQVSKSQAIR